MSGLAQRMLFGGLEATTIMDTHSELLVVEDDDALRQMLRLLFQDEGYRVWDAGSAEGALDLSREHEIDVVLSDVNMPGASGIELVGELRRIRPETPVILMTAFGSVASAVEAMRAGAFDYITKPFENEVALLAIERALSFRALEEENRRLRLAVDRTSALGDLIGTSPAMRDVFALVRKIAHSRASVLITGESGTGKDVVARTIHFHGSRAREPFLPINCTALPEGLLESELFGHVRGAFTGAHAAKRGLFEKATGGTLFLDEIGDMSLALQGKLLRVLQDGEVRPVGGTQSAKVDVRIIAATNRDLARAIDDGSFREDLYYRLNVIPLHMPPLRERPEDIPPLAAAFLRKHSTEHTRTLSAAAVAWLKAQPWRGNARELENAIERALVLSDAVELGVDDLRTRDARSPSEPDPGAQLIGSAADSAMSLKELEDRYTEEILRRTGGNKVQAAAILKIDRKTLYRRAERRSRGDEREPGDPKVARGG
jgi:DNA-binding NtrC family response regulator